MIYDDLKKWLNLSTQERRGSFIFFLLILSIGIAYNMTERYYKPSINITEQQIALIDSLIQVYGTDEAEVASSSKRILNLRSFNPNKVKFEELIELGIPERTSKIWNNYLNSGARFTKSEDLLKIYSMDTALYQQLVPYITLKEKTEKRSNPPIKTSKKETSKEKLLFSFDPNSISEDSLELLDLSSRVKSNIINYRKAGGTFYNPEKIRDMYSMTDSIYQVIEPYINIDSSQFSKTPIQEFTENNSYQERVNLNAADSAALIKLKGIGPFRAKILIERRENIGGYHSLNQLYDGLYSIDSQVVEQIKPQLYIDSSYRRIELKDANSYKLSSHYYFDHNMAKSAINYFRNRDQRTELDQFISTSPISVEKWKKVRPYLELN